jgi:hypothetical protein
MPDIEKRWRWTDWIFVAMLIIAVIGLGCVVLQNR